MVDNFLFHEETLFMNPEVFDFDYVPEEYMFRADQMKEIVECLKPAINKKRPVNCMLSGLPSTGKTTSLKKIFEELTGYSNIILVHINGRISNTTFRVYSEIHKKLLGYTPPDSGVSVTSLYQKIFEVLEKEKKVLVIALDDAVFLEDCDEIIYHLSRANEVYTGVKIGIIAVLSEKEKYIIEDKSVSVFRPRIIEYEPYLEDEIFEILKKRSDVGFYANVVSEDILRIISNYAVENDLRFGIELLRQSAIEAENKSEKKILKSHVENAYGKILKSIDGNGKIEIDDKEKIILKILNVKSYSSGDLYELFCKKEKVSYSGFYRLIDKLKKKKLVSVEEKIVDGRGRTRIIKRI